METLGFCEKDDVDGGGGGYSSNLETLDRTRRFRMEMEADLEPRSDRLAVAVFPLSLSYLIK